jgi:hypothetical protein
VDGKHTTFEGKEGGDPALDQDTLAKLHNCTNEHQLVALLTHPLEDIFDDSVCLVNSEKYQWLRTSQSKIYNQMPDLFLCHEACYTMRKPWKANTNIPERKEDHKFGQITDWSLRECLAATFEAKLAINNRSIGEAANYGAHIVSGDRAPPLAKIVLFDKTKFFLMTVHSVVSITITESQWSTPGSKKLLQDFPLYKHPWTEMVNEACQKWKLKIARNQDGSAWLGRGGYGHVFCVKKDGSDKLMAIKVVQKVHSNILSLEKEMFRQVAKKCDFVMPIEEQEEDLDCALLMSHVGSPVEQNQYQNVIRLLASLHRAGFCRGDPRLANVVSVEGKFYWIDFMSLPWFTNQQDMVEDMKKLVASVLQVDLTMMQQSEALECYDAFEEATVDAVIFYVQRQLMN